jgi:putative spermidine/putrescine transport system permease protein
MRTGGLAGWHVAVLTLYVLYVGLPMLATFLFSIGDKWTSTVLPESYSLKSYEAALADVNFWPTLGRSTILAACAVVGNLLLAVPALYWLHVRGLRGVRPLLELLTILPFAVPGVVLALGLIRLYAHLPFRFTGTPAIVIAAHVVIALPFMFWAVDNSLRAIRPRVLTEAAYTLGARWDQALLQVIAPNILPGLISGSLLVFAASFGEFTLANLLVGAAWRTLPIWQYNSMRLDGHLTSALSVISFVVTWGASLLILWFASRGAQVEAAEVVPKAVG